MSNFIAFRRQREDIELIDFSNLLSTQDERDKVLLKLGKAKTIYFIFGGKHIAQNYAGQFLQADDCTVQFGSNAAVRKRNIGLTNANSQAVNLQKTLLDPKMLGLREPKSDLDHLRDYARVTSMASQMQEFEEQDLLVKKVTKFLNYLVLVKYAQVWRPHQSMKEMQDLMDVNHKFSSKPWLNQMLITSSSFLAGYNQRQQESLSFNINGTERAYFSSLAQVMTSNLNFKPGEYSIWDRLCTEEFLECLAKLKQGAPLTEIKDTLVQINSQSESFDEVLCEQKTQSESLTKSKLQLLKAAQDLSAAISNTPSDLVTLTDRVKMNLRLADVTLDVNHVLGALIHLVQAFNEDLETARNGLEGADFSASNEDLFGAFISLLPKLGSSSNVDLKSLFIMAPAYRLPGASKRPNQHKFFDPDTENDEPNLKTILSKLFWDELDRKYEKDANKRFYKYVEEEDPHTSLLKLMVFLANILLQGSFDHLNQCSIMDFNSAHFFEQRLFSAHSVHQKPETFSQLDRLARMLLETAQIFDQKMDKTNVGVKALHKVAEFVQLSVTQVLQTNLFALVSCQNAKHLDQMLSAHPETQFAGLAGTQSQVDLLFNGLKLKAAFTGSVEATSRSLESLIDDGAERRIYDHDKRFTYLEGKQNLTSAIQLEQVLPMLYEISRPEHLRRLISTLQPQFYKNLLECNGYVLELIIQNMDLVLIEDSAESDLKQQIDTYFYELICVENGEDHPHQAKEASADKGWLHNRQKAFVNRYWALHILQIVEGEEDQYKRGIIDLLTKLSNECQQSPLNEAKSCFTKRGLACIYQLFLAALIKKELSQDAELTQAFKTVLDLWSSKQSNGTEQQINYFLLEIAILQSTKIHSMFEQIEDVEAGELNAAQQEILESQILSGGLPVNHFNCFGIGKLDHMIADAELAGEPLSELVGQLSEAKTTMESLKKVNGFIHGEQEKLLHELINEGENATTDIICEALQLALKQKGGLVANYCHAGQQQGMQLTRAAFAVLIKFQGLTPTLQELFSEADQSSIPAEAGSDRDDAIVSLIDDCVFGEEFLACWSNATKMRRWLIHKKQQISQKYELETDNEEREKKSFDEIVLHVVKKAEILTLLQQPSVPFKAEKDHGDETLRISSQSKQQSSWLADEVFDIKKRVLSTIGRKKLVEEAGTSSVLALLQTPITAPQIVFHLANASHKAIRRLTAFQLILRMFEDAKAQENHVMTALIVTWLHGWQTGSQQMKHYTDGLEGCGPNFQKSLMQVFCAILLLVGDELTKVTSEDYAIKLLKAFNCKFKTSDFQFLSKSIKIFPLLFGNRQKDGQQSLLQKCWAPNNSLRDLRRGAMSSVQEIFVAIVGRIAHGDELKEVKLDDQAPKLARAISLLDFNWAEIIVCEALTEMLNLLEQGMDHSGEPAPFLTMIYLLLNVAQADAFTCQLVKKFFSSKQIGMLCKIMDNCNDTLVQLQVLKVLESLFKLNLQQKVLDQVVSNISVDSTPSLCNLAINFAQNPLASNFIDRAVKSREVQNQSSSQQKYALGKQLIKTVFTTMVSETEALAFLSKSAHQLRTYTVAEISIYFEILGSSLETFAADDEVYYTRKNKANQIYESALSDYMIVRHSRNTHGKHKLKVFSTVHGENKRIHKCDIQIKRPISFELPTDTQVVFVELLETNDVDLLMAACLIKYFLQHAAAPEILPRLCAALIPLRERLSDAEKLAHAQWQSHRCFNFQKDIWNERNLSIIVLEEHLMQRWIAMIEAQESFVGSLPKIYYYEESDEGEENSIKQEIGSELELCNNRGSEAYYREGDPISIPFDHEPGLQAKALKSVQEQEGEEESKGAPEVLAAICQQTLLVRNFFKRSQQGKIHVKRHNDKLIFCITATMWGCKNSSDEGDIYGLKDEDQRIIVASIALMLPEKRDAYLKVLTNLAKPQDASLRSNEEQKLTSHQRCAIIDLAKQQLQTIFLRKQGKVVNEIALVERNAEMLKEALRSGADGVDKEEINALLKFFLSESHSWAISQPRINRLNRYDEEENYKDEDSEEYANKDYKIAQDTVKRKILKSPWDEFQPNSKIQVSKMKQGTKRQADMFHYHSKKPDTRRQLYLMEKKSNNGVADMQNSMTIRLLVHKLSDMLLYESISEDAAMLSIYLDKKLMKYQSLNHAIWATNRKHFDKEIVHAYLKRHDSDVIMAMAEVEQVFNFLDQKLNSQTYKSSSVTSKKIVQMNLLIRVSTVLLQGDPESIFKYGVKITNGLLQSIWFTTKLLQLAIQDRKNDEKPMLQLLIRKLLGTCLKVVEKLCQEPLKMVKTGLWQEIVSLESLAQLNKLLPNEVTNIRNLFQFIFVQILVSLADVREKSVELLTEDTRRATDSLPFWIISFQMKQIKASLDDIYLQGNSIESQNKAKKFIADQKITQSLSSFEKVAGTDVDGGTWFKIVLTTDPVNKNSKKKLRLTLADIDEYYCGKIAVSSEPRMNTTTQIKTLVTHYSLKTNAAAEDKQNGQTDKNIRKCIELENLSGEAVYIKYPLQGNLQLMRLQQDPNEADCDANIRLIDLDGLSPEYWRIQDERFGSPYKLESLNMNKLHVHAQSLIIPNQFTLIQPSKDLKNLVHLVIGEHDQYPYGHTNVYEFGGVLEPGDSIKSISQFINYDKRLNQYRSEIETDDSRRDKRGEYAFYNFFVLTEKGHIFTLKKNFSESSLYTQYWSKYPQLHSELPPYSIDQIQISSDYLFVLNKNGELFCGLSSEKAREMQQVNKTMILKLPMAQLDNGTTIQRFTKMHYSFSSQKNVLVLYVEGMTEDGITVLFQQENPTSLKLVPICSGVRQVSMWNSCDQIECLDDEEDEICIIKSSTDNRSPYGNEKDDQNVRICDKTGLPKPSKTKLMKGLEGDSHALRFRTGHALTAVEFENQGIKSFRVFSRKLVQDEKTVDSLNDAISKRLTPLLSQGTYELVDFYVEFAECEKSTIYIILQHTAKMRDIQVTIGEEDSLSQGEITVTKPVGKPTENVKAHQDALQKRWAHSVELQFKLKQEILYKKMRKHKNDSNFILKFFKRYMKRPKLFADELPADDQEETKEQKVSDSLCKEMQQFVNKSLQTAQIVYDLLPIADVIGNDPYLSSFEQGKQFMASYQAQMNRSHGEVVRQAQTTKISSYTPAINSGSVRVQVRRIKANEFALKKRFETETEHCTLFTQFMKQFRSPEAWKQRTRRPFHVNFLNEASIDAGGPMRDAISNLCKEITSQTVLPLLVPTANNVARMEPCMDCFTLNSNSKEPYMLEKFTFMGYFIGWSLRNKGGLAIDLPLCLWRRLCHGSQRYIYTVEDLRELDVFRAEMLTQIEQHAKELDSDEAFSIFYDGYTFVGSFDSGVDGTEVTVELCPGGAERQLTRANVAEYIQMFLSKYTEQDALQFERVWIAIQDCVGESMLLHLTASNAANRTCSQPLITKEAFKSAVEIHIDDSDVAKKNLKWFWENFDDMNKSDRSLLLKFFSGDSRIKPSVPYRIGWYEHVQVFPRAATCGYQMYMPFYQDQETAKKNVLTAIRLCGEIDDDGRAEDYGAEVEPAENESANLSDDAYDENADRDSEEMDFIRMDRRAYPIQLIRRDRNLNAIESDKDSDEEVEAAAELDDADQDWDLRELASDDEANERVPIDVYATQDN